MKKVKIFAVVSFAALLADCLLLRFLNYFSFTPFYAFGFVIVGVVFFVLACRQSRDDERLREHKAARRRERIAAGENLKPLKPYKKPWYVGGFGFLLLVCLVFAALGFYVIRSSGLSSVEYAERYGSGKSDAAAAASPIPTSDPDVASPGPTVAPIPDPVTYTGSGDDVIEVTPFADALYVFEITGNADERYFAVESYDSQNKSDLLVNTTDKYSGITMDTGFDVAMLQVTATGDWQITQRSLYDMDVVEQGQTYSGTGDRIILVRGSGKTASITGNAGERYFSIQSYDSQGRGDLLVNTTDKYDGKVMLNDPIIFQVSAVGDWSITLN